LLSFTRITHWFTVYWSLHTRTHGYLVSSRLHTHGYKRTPLVWLHTTVYTHCAPFYLTHHYTHSVTLCGFLFAVAVYAFLVHTFHWFISRAFGLYTCTVARGFTHAFTYILHWFTGSRLRCSLVYLHAVTVTHFIHTHAQFACGYIRFTHFLRSYVRSFVCAFYIWFSRFTLSGLRFYAPHCVFFHTFAALPGSTLFTLTFSLHYTRLPRHTSAQFFHWLLPHGLRCRRFTVHHVHVCGSFWRILTHHGSWFGSPALFLLVSFTLAFATTHLAFSLDFAFLPLSSARFTVGLHVPHARFWDILPSSTVSRAQPVFIPLGWILDAARTRLPHAHSHVCSSHVHTAVGCCPFLTRLVYAGSVATHLTVHAVHSLQHYALATPPTPITHLTVALFAAPAVPVGFTTSPWLPPPRTRLGLRIFFLSRMPLPFTLSAAFYTPRAGLPRTSFPRLPHTPRSLRFWPARFGLPVFAV